METRTYTVYKFSELSETAQKNAIENNRSINVDFWAWYHAIFDNFLEDTGKLGYEEIKPMFSGFSSRGDGACFTASVNLEKWIVSHKVKSKVRNLWNSAIVQDMDYTLTIVHSGLYYHEKSVSLQAEADGYPDKAYAEFYDVVAPMIEAEIVTLSKKLYKDLEEEYDYCTSDGAVTATLTENEYDFKEDGTMAQE